MKKIFFALAISLLFTNSYAQQKVCVAFYNQENLFDTINDPNKNDEEFLPEGKYKWNSERYYAKLNNMAKVISALNPDFLGMCEVESIHSLTDLLSTNALITSNYQPVFFEGPDERGIDNALIFKKAVVKEARGKIFTINPEGLGGDKTRGILFANITLNNNEHLYFLVNHFPSRREGEKESEPKRLYVAGVVKHICDSLYKKDAKANIIVMGDFNDYPNNASVKEVIGATGDVKNIQATGFFNPMYSLMEQGKGSYRHKGEWNFLDQIMLSHNLVDCKTKVCYKTNSADVFKQEWMLETEEKYKGNPLRTFGGMKFLNGYSDHLPVMLYLDIK